MPKKCDRPIFQYTDSDNVVSDVKAGGVLFYKIDDDDHIKFLMIKNRGKYEDFGGCTDNGDKNIMETIAREVQEESNNIFKKKDILNRIKTITPIYSKISKYLLYIIPL